MNKFAVMAVDQSGVASFWNGKGWVFLSRTNTTSEKEQIATLESKDACAVRDAAKAHQINKEIKFHVIRVA